MKLAISFSGGKTSAYMTKWLIDNKVNDYDDYVITFANTGQENEETLRFINRCDKEWNLNVVWLEAVVNPLSGIGTKHKIVTYETASRNGEPFEAVIKKYGIPNQTFQTCNREMKLAVMRSYMRSIGWKKRDYVSAIGIRIDEIDRISKKMNDERLIYPLIEFTKATKESIGIWWEKQQFNLNLMEHEGNCKWCWKKSKRKLLTLAVDTPEIFDFPARMERDYGYCGAAGYDKKPRVFFRGYTSTIDLMAESKLNFVRWTPKPIQFNLFDEDLDSSGGCSEHCEAY